jgi:hypothetical protein
MTTQTGQSTSDFEDGGGVVMEQPTRKSNSGPLDTTIAHVLSMGI